MLGLVLICAAHLFAVQDNQTNGFYRLNAEARMTLYVDGFESDAAVPVSVITYDEFEREVASVDIRIPTDAAGKGSAATLLKTDRYGFFRVRAKTSTGVTLPKLGSRPQGCITYAVMHAPDERRSLNPENCFFGCFSDGPGPMTPWLGMHLLYGNSTPSPDSNEVARASERRRAAAWKYGGTVTPGNTFHLNRFCSDEARRFMKARGGESSRGVSRPGGSRRAPSLS